MCAEKSGAEYYFMHNFANTDPVFYYMGGMWMVPTSFNDITMTPNPQPTLKN